MASSDSYPPGGGRESYHRSGNSPSKRGWRDNHRGRGTRGGGSRGGYRNEISAPGNSRGRGNYSNRGGNWREEEDRAGWQAGGREDGRERTGAPQSNIDQSHRPQRGSSNQGRGSSSRDDANPTNDRTSYGGSRRENQRKRNTNNGSGGGVNAEYLGSSLNPMAPSFVPGAGATRTSTESTENDNEVPDGYSGNRSPYKGSRNRDRQRNERSSALQEVQQQHFKLEWEVERTSWDGKSRNQREVLMDQLSRSIYECMVCCEKVRASQPVWSCKRCFNVFHLNCIRKWATSSVDENGWRCPGCQSYCDLTPTDYYCFCGKVKSPKSSKYDTPHTCGQTCGKPNPGGLKCTHACISQCHPGPCPSCEVQQIRYCGCGKTSASVLCGSKTILSCDSICNKILECRAHSCTQKCHSGECEECTEKLTHLCFCSSKRKEVPCTQQNNYSKTYSCSDVCRKPLRCGSHVCDSICHSGSCGPCKTSTEAVMSCPCGQTSIAEACKAARLPIRRKCTDPIPVCGKICQKILPCGDMNLRHRCQRKCHLENICPPCDLTSSMKCRCGSKTVELPCKDLRSSEDITCQKKCSRKKSCGKHKCTSKCCIDVDHICTVVCQRQLRCGIHNCSSLCHLNPCPPCGVVSFDELSCECGASIIYPPVPCGTRRPPCHLPCSREHSCDHPVHHPCHSEANCPPCTVLTEKWCHGKHELRKNIMCHITQLSCGLPCGKKLDCNRHACPKTCHAGQCLHNGEVCKLPCDTAKACGHKCGAPCHDNGCPESKCKIMTHVTCPCGRKTDSLICWKRDNEYDKTVTWEYHKEIKRLEEEAKTKGEKFELDDSIKQDIMETMKEKNPISAVLECDKECAKVERNRKLAEALQVENADVTTSIGTPNYSEFLTKFAKKNPQFIETIHKQLSDLVMKAKQSRKKNETYGFNSMNRDKRHVIHEYSDHFGILSESFDEEPNRNVVCFASKEKSYLPSVTLIDAVFRPAVRPERLKPNDDVTFHSEKRAPVVRPSNWAMKPKQISTAAATGGPQRVALNIPGTSNQSSDFPPL